jgi:hypothetical protein
MQRLKASRLSQTEAVSLKRLAAGAPHSSISSDHFGRFRKLMLIERHGSTWKLTPLGLHQLQGVPNAARMTSADPLALLENMVTKQHALRQHRGLVRERQAGRPSNGTIPVSGREQLVPAALERDALANDCRRTLPSGAHALIPRKEELPSRLNLNRIVTRIELAC